MNHRITLLAAVGLGASAVSAGQGPSERGIEGPPGSCDFTCLTAPPDVAPDGHSVLSAWPGGIIAYTFLEPPDAFAPTADQRAQMLDAMAKIEAATSIRFIERTTEENYVRIRRNDPGITVGSFSSHIGYCACGMQEIVIGDYHWDLPGVLMHEWGHALGLWHEHQRPDRDPFIEVAPAETGGGYVAIGWGLTNGPYDFASLMHYNPYDTIGGLLQRVLIVKEPYRRVWQYRIGQVRRFDATLSNGDLWVLHRLYPSDPPPRYFELVSPASGALVGSSWAPSFSWAPSEAATLYRLQVAEDPAFAAPIIDVETTQTNYDDPGILEADRLYWWRVIASSSTGETASYPFDKLPFYAGSAYPATVYVDDDAPAGGDGASWAAPLQDLATALEIAHASDGAVTEIRVAGGEYKPDYGSGDRDMSFWLADDCAVRGGYAGFGAPDPDARDIDLHETILSGDLAGDDAPGFLNIDDNSNTVLMSLFNPSATLLEGVTIRGGNAGRWRESLIAWGAGANVSGGAPVFRQCRFENNNADDWGGGMAVAFSEPAPLLDRCEFTGNRAGQWSGALWLWDSDVTIENCEFLDNVALTEPARPLLWVLPQAVGGAVGLEAGAEATLINSLFADNTAMSAGAGALGIADGSGATIINSTFSQNAAPIGAGGAIRATQGSRITIVNSVLWDDSLPELAVLDISTSDITYSDVAGGWPGTGNINVDPMFADPATGDYRLSAGSPAIDTGSDSAVPAGVTTDLAGLPRFVGPVDMGAYEFQNAGCYADCDATGTLDFFDFLCFQNLFALGDPQADCDESGVLDIFDFLCFQNAFAAGCP